MRFLAGISGVAVVGAALHANVTSAGGWASPDAPLIAAIALLLAIGMAYAGTVWQSGTKLGAIALVFCLLAGETYWLAINAERELTAREVSAGPSIELEKKRVAAAERLKAAVAAKAVTDKTAFDKAAEKDCRVNCIALLTAAQTKADTEVATARAALDVLPPPEIRAALAGKIGVPQWLYDLVLSGLRSLAVVGGSLVVGLALHQHKRAPSAVAPPLPLVEPPMSQMQPLIAPPVARAVDPREHVSTFLKVAIRPSAQDALSLRALQGQYTTWCQQNGMTPLPPRDFGVHLRVIIDAIGLDCEPTTNDVLVRGAALAA